MGDFPIPPVLAARAAAGQDDERAPHVLVARYRKARAVATTLLQHGATAAQVEELGKMDIGRALAAQAAGTRIPSTTTWALVVELVREVRP